MSNNLFSKVEGKSIIVGDFQIENYNENLHIKITCISEDKNTYLLSLKMFPSWKCRTYHIPSKFADLKYWITAHAVIKRIHVSLWTIMKTENFRFSARILKFLMPTDKIRGTFFAWEDGLEGERFCNFKRFNKTLSDHWHFISTLL